jgi:hypothetical protein
MDRGLLRGIFIALVSFLFCFGCASSNKSMETDKLDKVIRDAITYLNGRLPQGNKILVLSIKSEYPLLSDYIIDGLVENIVNDGLFSVVDRQQLEAIKEELNFQLSGDVDDDTAQSIGKMVGAQTIVSGSITIVGDFYRLGMRAIKVETAEVQGQFNRNIPDGPIISFLSVRKNSTEDRQNKTEDRQNNNQTKNPDEEIMPGFTGEVTNGKYTGTTWSDGLNPPSTIIFGNNSLKLTGYYWGNMTGKIYESNMYSNQIQVWVSKSRNEGFELMEYWDGRLIVQGQKPHFFSEVEQ